MKNKHYLITVAIVISFVLLYMFFTQVVILLDPMLFPNVSLIGKAFVDSIPKLFESLWSSCKLLIPGFGLALLSGVIIGVLLGINPTVSKILKPIIFALNPIPPSMLTPYLLAIMPTFYLSSVSVIFIGCFWPILGATMSGIIMIDQKYLDYGKMIELKGMKQLFHVLLPAAAPSILAGIKTALNFGFILLAIAEMFATNSGLGYFIQYYADFSDYARVISGIIFMGLFIILIMVAFEKIRNRILFWTLNENNN